MTDSNSDDGSVTINAPTADSDAGSAVPAADVADDGLVTVHVHTDSDGWVPQRLGPGEFMIIRTPEGEVLAAVETDPEPESESEVDR